MHEIQRGKGLFLLSLNGKVAELRFLKSLPLSTVRALKQTKVGILSLVFSQHDQRVHLGRMWVESDQTFDDNGSGC